MRIISIFLGILLGSFYVILSIMFADSIYSHNYAVAVLFLALMWFTFQVTYPFYNSKITFPPATPTKEQIESESNWLIPGTVEYENLNNPGIKPND